MRAAVVCDVKPEIIWPRDFERQLVVLPRALSNKNFSAFNFQRPKTFPLSPRERTAAIGSRVRVTSRLAPNLADNCQPRIPVLDRLQPPGLLFEQCHPITHLIQLLANDRLSPAGLLVALEHPLDVFLQTDSRIERYIDGFWFFAEVIRNLNR